MSANLDWAKEAPTRKNLLLGGGHLAALWAITFVQPLLDLLGKNPDFFVARGNTPGDILILAFGFTLLPPLVMLLVEFVASKIAPQVYYAVHFLFFWGIATFLFVQLLSNFFERPTILLVLLSLILGALFAYAVFKVVFIKNLMDILIIAPVVILALFIFASDSTKAIFPEEESVDIGATVEAKTPVVMVVMDELGTSTLMTEQGKIDGSRFPNFARLAKESTWYPNQSTTSYFTPTAVPGILTGNIPDEDALPTASDQPNNIFSLLSGSYKFHVEEPITSICPDSLCPEGGDESQTTRLKSLYSDLKYVEGRLVLPPRIADTLPDVGTNFEGFGGGGGGEEKKKSSIDDLFVKGRGGAKAPSQYSEFINKIPAGDNNLTMMHIKQPHQPWKYDVDGVQYNPSPIDQLSESTGLWKVDENGVASAQARQIVQTGFADTLLGQVIDRLKSTGVWDRAMVLVMADHGVDFQGGDVPQRMAGEESMGEVANPPLFIKYPNQEKGKVDPIHSMTLDVVPTIAEELRVKGMYETDGVPLQGDDVPEREITVKNVKNESFSLPIAEVIKQRDAAIAEKNRRFGTGPFYTLGPAPQLIGKPAPKAGAANEVALDKAQLWQNYKPGRGLLPIFVNGTISGGNAGDTIAVGVNGKIQGTTKSFDFEGAQRFGTLVDPKSLVEGRNEITIYRVGGGNSLTPIGSNRAG